MSASYLNKMTDKEYNYKNSHIASKVKFKLNTIKYNGIYTIHFNITDLIIKSLYHLKWNLAGISNY